MIVRLIPDFKEGWCVDYADSDDDDSGDVLKGGAARYHHRKA